MQMNYKSRRVIDLIVYAAIFGFLAILFPKAHELFGPRFFCYSIEVDVNSGLLRHTRFVFGMRIYRRQEQTAFASEIVKIGEDKSPPKWIEGLVKAGIDDYYARHIGGKLLKSVKMVSSITQAKPELIETNSALIRQMAAALRQTNYDAFDKCIRELIEVYKP
jgi:hypothetical protein